MTTALAASLALVAAYCLARCAVPAWRPHGAAVEAWHVAMAVAMVAMLLAPVRRDAALLQLLVFAGGVAWCLAHLTARQATGAHLRLGAGLGVMATMLVPAAFAAPASAAMPGMDHATHGAADAPVPLLAVAVGVTVLLGAAAALTVVRSGGWPARLGALCELVMATGMATMLLA